ncbi:10885_t:CDS:2, partial [Funneliformis geosporum]
MFRPQDPEFENLTYPQYFQFYSITLSRPSTTRQLFQDQDAELFFYQKRLLTIPARNESDYRIGPNGTYCEKFLSLFPDYLNNLHNDVASRNQSRVTHLNNQFSEMLDRLLVSLQYEIPNNIQNIIKI